MLGPMKAVVITRPGGPEVLELDEVEDPAPGSEEIRVRVRAAGMNRADLHQRRGLYPAPPGSPADIPGLEFAGEVELCGDRVRNLWPGDRVMGIVGGGAHAEKLVLHHGLCLEVPKELSWEEAAAIPEVFLTAYDALFQRSHLGPGEVVLLHAAASGVGTAAAQLAQVAGAKVIGLSRSSEKRRKLEALGLALVLDPAAEDVAERIRRVGGERGVDVVLDLVGAASWALNLEVIAEQGRLILVGTLSGSKATVDLGLLMRKRVTVIGTVLRSRPLEEKMELVRIFSRHVLPMLAEGRLRAIVDRVLPLEQVAAAHEILERNESFGKIVLRVD